MPISLSKNTLFSSVGSEVSIFRGDIETTGDEDVIMFLAASKVAEDPEEYIMRFFIGERNGQQ